MRPAEGEVHVWRVDQSARADVLEERRALLSADERERAERYRFDLHRERFVMRRGALRRILAECLGADPRSIALRPSRYGRPELDSPHDTDLRFSVSHSEDLALIAVTRGCEVGVDVEFVRRVPEMDRLAREVFSPAEQAEFEALAPEEKPRGFYNGWTRKEAWLKARGEGLIGDLAGFDVTLTPGRAARIVRVAAAPDEAGAWRFRAFAPQRGFVAAVAVRSRSCRLVRWTF